MLLDAAQNVVRPPREPLCRPVRLGYVRATRGKDLGGNAAFPEGFQCNRVLVEEIETGSCGTPILEDVLMQLGRGDTLIVRRLGHLGSSTKAIVQILERLDKAGIHICSVEDGVAEGSMLGEALTRAGSILAAVQRDLKRDRTREGQKDASAAGRLRGARPTLTPKMLKVVRHLMTETDLTMSQIAETIGTSRNTLYRTLKREAERAHEISSEAAPCAFEHASASQDGGSDASYGRLRN